MLSRPLIGALAACAFASTPAQAAFGDHALRRGSHGHDVRVLQRWLGLVGFRTAVDGQFGRATARAVRRYERSRGQHVDGRLSRPQARRLRREAYAVAAAQPAASPTPTATIAADGRTAVAPPSAPAPVQAAIAAANEITRTPYEYGGGHGSFTDDAYDCSGAVSHVLHAAGVLDAPEDSSLMMRYGQSGQGSWITVYANRTHAYMVIAGLRFDTSGRGESGPRWRPETRSSGGFTVRHPPGM